MEETFDRNNRLIAMGVTTLFAVLLFIIFLFIKFITPIPPFEESAMGGLEVNFGFDNQGMGDNNSLQPVSDNQKKDNPTSQSENNSSSEMLSSEDANNVTAPPIKNKNTEIKVEEPTVDQNLLSALNKMNNKIGRNTG